MKASTWSTAVSTFKDLAVDLTLDFCNVGHYSYNGTYRKKEQKYLYIKAVATLLLQSKLMCETDGKYALACASSWAGAYSFASAAFEAYAGAWVDTDLKDCHCSVNVLAQADALISSGGEIWVSIYQGLDDSVCASSCAPPTYRCWLCLHLEQSCLFVRFAHLSVVAQSAILSSGERARHSCAHMQSTAIPTACTPRKTCSASATSC